MRTNERDLEAPMLTFLSMPARKRGQRTSSNTANGVTAERPLMRAVDPVHGRNCACQRCNRRKEGTVARP